MPQFISCDWGTSALRLRVVDMDNRAVLAEISGSPGISATFTLWKQSGKQESERLSFYQAVLTENIIKLEEILNFPLQHMPVIISGMASSNMGMIELPYKEIPFNIDGHDLHIKTIEASSNFKHKSLVVSGVKTLNDVMRGEETQLIGCLNGNDNEDKLCIFPGTHSKHVKVEDNRAVDFKTYMTGEFFELLAKKSILSNAVDKADDVNDTFKMFETGIADSMHSNILHNSFLVRTNHLFGKLSKQENYYYLSGLLIGTELKELINNKTPLIVAGDESQVQFYSIALAKLGLHKVRYTSAAKAIVQAHCKIYDLYKTEF